MTGITITPDGVRVALLELLGTGRHHHAATPATLATVGQARQSLGIRLGADDPTAAHTGEHRRLAALTRALGEVSTALFTAWLADATPDSLTLRAPLADLAALALGWLDATDTDVGGDEESPF